MDGSRQGGPGRPGAREGRRATDPVAPPAPVQPAAPRRLPLGQMLIARGLITDDQLRIALIEQGTRKQPVGKVLVALGFLSEVMLRDALATDMGTEQAELSQIVPDGTALGMIPREFASANLVFPVAFDPQSRTLKVAVTNPNDIVLLDRLRAQLPPNHNVSAIIGAEGEISTAIQKHYEYSWSIDGILREIETGEVDIESLDASGKDYSGPVVRLVDSILADAVQRRASDLHFEPEAGFLRIRYRIDGVLRQIRAIHQKHWTSMLSRLKIMSGMNIAEQRAPQDGRCSLTVYGRTIDFRAAVQPTVYGENFVLRILDRNAALVPLETLGFEPEQLEQVETMISRPIGILLVTGPTGSGKTTTLYSMLQRQNRVDVNIMTLEDPVEYPLPMVRQADLSSGIKMEFASGIRSLMRQDPDIILLGEIRDADTATMALRAAMTGHQVFSTLHTNSAVGALVRLFDLGLTPELLAGNLVGILGQRLARRLCMSCREAYDIDEDLARLLEMRAEAPRRIYRPVGCPDCEFQGYRGRIAIIETLRLDDELDELIVRRCSQWELLRAAQKKGFRPLANAALRRVGQGDTSLEEAARVVDLTRMGNAGESPASEQARQPDADAVSTFSYRAATATGSIRRGRLAALNPQELEARLRLIGLDLIDAHPQAISRWSRRMTVPRRELISFCVHMETTLTARVQLIDALADLAESTTHPRFREVASMVLDRVREGASLSAALRDYPQVFDAVFIGLVESGERSGHLDQVFARLAANLKWQDEIISATKKALTYPAFTLVVLLGATLFILLYLVPQLSEFIRSANEGKLPFQTWLLLSLSQFVQSYWYLLPVPPLLVVATVFGISRAGSENLKRRIDGWRLRIPVVGPILSRLAIARFAGLFGMLYASGVPVLVSLEVAEGAIGNRALAEGAERARNRIAQGSSMTDAFAEAALFPNLLLRMIRIGETTGDIDKAMKNVTYFYEREIQDSIQRLESLAEPVLTMILGLLLGWLMMAVLGPLYDLLSKMKV